MPTEEHTEPIHRLAWIWKTIARNAAIIPVYAIVAMVVNIVVGGFYPRLSNVVMIYLIIAPVVGILLLMLGITAVLAMFGGRYD